jgi:hypothetical protein
MTGEMLKPLEGRPYLKSWQERMAEPVKVKPKPHKKGKKAKRARA